MKRLLWSGAALLSGLLAFRQAGWPADPPAALVAALGAGALEGVFCVPLQFGFFSLVTPLSYVLAAWPGIGGSGALIASGLALSVRALGRSRQTAGRRWDELLCDLIPAWLAAAAVARWGSLYAFPLLVVLALPLTAVLRRQLGPMRDTDELSAFSGEIFGLSCLAPMALQGGPGLWLAAPVAWALRRSSQAGRQLEHFQAGRAEVRQQRRALSQQHTQVVLTAEQQAARERQLNARAEAFLMLERLSAQSAAPEEVLAQIGATLQSRFPSFSLTLVWAGEPRHQVGPGRPDRQRAEQVLRRGQPLLLEDQGYWPLAPQTLVWLGWESAPGSEVLHSLQIFLGYAWALLERAQTQRSLVQALAEETGLRRQLSLHVEQLRALIQGSERLAELSNPGEVLELAAGFAGQLAAGQPCRIAPVSGSASYGLGEWGRLEFAGPELSPERHGMIELWARMVEGRLRRNQAMSQLSQAGKLAAIGQLAAGVSHELNTPLGALTLALEVAQQNVESRPERALSRIQQSLKAAASMQQIISKLLYYARESGQGRRSADLAAIAGDALTMVEHSWEGLGLRPQVHLEAVAVQVDPGEIHQVLVNLLMNAGQALRQGTPPLRLELRVGARSGWACAEVEDSGPGVAAEVAERIFEPFFTTREVGQGTGLGLSISRQLAESHGGSLDYRPGANGGACFRLLLPL